jgi:Zn finger protein HypA/HybF involved in hydrogenase expression
MMTKGKMVTTEEPKETKVTLQCNECGKKRKVSPDGNYNDRCPKCGGVDWDVL